MRETLGLFTLIVALATLALLRQAAAGDAATIDACLQKEREANRSGRDCIGRVSDPCLKLEGHDSTTEMVQCVDTETKAWDDLLNADYQRVLNAVGDKAKEAIRQAERAWIALRDADCGVPYEIYEGGTMARLGGASCLLDHTAERVLQLRIWYEMAQPE
jgi:uncharacterized protein YecT (DUF1311 family)